MESLVQYSLRITLIIFRSENTNLLMSCLPHNLFFSTLFQNSYKNINLYRLFLLPLFKTLVVLKPMVVRLFKIFFYFQNKETFIS